MQPSPELLVTTDTLLAFVPEQAAEFGVESLSDDGQRWERMKIGATKYWPLEELTCEWIADRWGDGDVYRVSYYKGQARRCLATTKPFRLDVEPEESDVAQPPGTSGFAPANEAAPPVSPPAPAYQSPGAHVAAHLRPQTIGALSAEQLVALLHAQAPRDESPIGLLERLYGMHDKQFATYSQLIRAEAERQVIGARTELERVKAEVEARAQAQVEQARMFYERLGSLEAGAREREATLLAQAQERETASVAELRDRIEELQEDHQQAVSELVQRAAQASGVEQQQTNQLIAALAPALPRVVEVLAHRFGGAEAGRVAGAIARGTTPAREPESRLGGLFDGIVESDAAE